MALHNHEYFIAQQLCHKALNCCISYWMTPLCNLWTCCNAASLAANRSPSRGFPLLKKSCKNCLRILRWISMSQSHPQEATTFPTGIGFYTCCNIITTSVSIYRHVIFFFSKRDQCKSWGVSFVNVHRLEHMKPLKAWLSKTPLK